MLKVIIFSDNSFHDIEDELKLNYQVVEENPDCAVVLFRDEKKLLDHLHACRNYQKVFIKPIACVRTIDFIDRNFNNVYYLHLRIKDMNLYGLKFDVYDRIISHIDIKLRGKRINLSDEFLHELLFLNMILGDDDFENSNLRVSRNKNTIHANLYNKSINLTCSIYISNISEYLDHNVQVYDIHGKCFELSTPSETCYFERFGASLCYILKNANPKWLKDQMIYNLNVASKIKSVRGLVIN